MNIHWIFGLICTLAALHGCWASPRRVVCYYTNWSAYRPGLAKFLPQNINPHLCTHLIYAFGGFTNEFMLKPFDKWQDIDQGGYAKFNGLKAHNKNLKTLLAIGGWNEGSQRFSKLVADPEARQNLVKSAIRYLRQHNFDGLDLDWEYPASRDGSKPADRANYALLVKELREGFDKESTNRPKLLLTMAVPAGFDTIEQGYDIRSLNRDLDFMNILSYDYHSAFEPQVNHHAPLRSLTDSHDFDPNENLNVDATVQLYLRNGASADKLVVGIPTYGRAYKLVSPDITELGSPADGPAEAGKATREKGYLAYYEICEKVGVNDWTVEKPDPDALGPFAYKDDEWVGYDDEEMAAKKAQYVLENGLGGVMFWSVDNDDFRGLCTGKQYPLIESAKAALLANDNATPVRGSNRKPTKNSQSSRPSQSGQRQPAPVKRVSTTTVRTTTSNIFTTPEPPTTPDSAVDFECKDEGFFPNPKDCKKYFWCLDSPNGLASHIFTCPSGLHFNKFTDSCDYATNVICKVGSASASATGSVSTARPFLAKSTSLGTKATTTTTTTTTTPEPEFEEYDDEEEEPEPIEKDDEDFSSPEELQQLLQLISDLGGVEAVKQLLERSTGRGHRGRQEGGQEIRLSSAQRQALEKVIRPTTVSSSRFRSRDRPIGETVDAAPPSRGPALKYVTLARQRTTTTPAAVAPEEEEVFEEEEEIEEEPVTTPRARLNIPREPIEEVPSTPASPGTRATLPLTTLFPTSFAQGGRTPASTATAAADVVSDFEDYETDAAEDYEDQETSIIPPIATTTTTAEPTTTTPTTTTTTATTTTQTTTTTTTTTTERTTTAESLVKRIKAIRGRLSRPRPTASSDEAPQGAVQDPAEEEDVEVPPISSTTRRPVSRTPSTRSPTTRPPSTRAPIKIAIPAPEGRPPSDEVFRRPSASDQDDLFGTGNVGHSAVGNHNGNVVEIDEDGRVFCFDVGNFAYPDDCRRFVQCAKENGVIRGWVHTCPKILSFDPVGAICNWGSPLRCLKV